MAALIERVRGAVRERDLGGAVELLTEEWATSPSEAVADAIDALDARLDEPAFDGNAEAWLVAATSATPRARGPLLRAILGRNGASTLAMLKRAASWRDPRLTHVYAQLLRTVPWSGTRSRVVWGQIFALLGNHGDARFVSLAAELPAWWTLSESLTAWLTDRLAAATAALVPGRDDPELAALVAELRAPNIPASARTLLAAIYANPDDDVPRQIYADWLQDRGDARGEVIALQLGHGGDRAHEHEVLEENRKAWLGPLAEILHGVELRRGFPATATVMFRHQRDVEQYGALAEWATLEELNFGNRSRDRWSGYVGPAMRHLRILRRADIAHVFGATTPWHRLTTLELDSPDVVLPSHVTHLVRSQVAPKLERLAIYNWHVELAHVPDWIAGLAVCPPHLTVSGELDHRVLAETLAAARRSALTSLTLRGYHDSGVTHRFTRDETGAFTRLDIEIRPPLKPTIIEPRPADPLPRLVTDLRALPIGSLTHFDAQVELDGKLVPAVPLFAAAKAALS